MKVVVYSKTPLTTREKQNVRDILRRSSRPDESLARTFPRYDSIEDGRIFFDDEKRHVRTEIEY
ncbi:MAG: hypothetical protein J6N51_10835 [Selenomonas sp.]|nr:hypothetical protein [Selenomonas sp.]